MQSTNERMAQMIKWFNR